MYWLAQSRKNHLDIENDIKLLKSRPNVHFLGGKASNDLPKYLNNFDVCLMPYLITNYTKYIYPMKLHEYFACGKPVVSTQLENIIEFKDYLFFANGVSD